MFCMAQHFVVLCYHIIKPQIPLRLVNELI